MVIGITGGVGCGKSTVLTILEKDFGCHIIEADKVGHLVMQRGEAYRDIVNVFGNGILGENYEIDRQKLGGIVFRDKEKLEKLNHIVHPAVKSYIKNEIKQVQKADPGAVIVVEAALLIEDNYQEFCDEIWYIYTKEEERFRRLEQSRGYTEEKTRSIMKNQLTEEEFLRHCDKRIDNSYDVKNTYHQIEKLFDY